MNEPFTASPNYFLVTFSFVYGPLHFILPNFSDVSMCVSVLVWRSNQDFCIIKGENWGVTGPNESMCEYHP